MASDQTQPNWLFRGLIIISLMVHVVLFMRITELYRPRTLTYIELTMKSLAKPFVREIPRPRFRPREQTMPEKVHRVRVQPKKAPLPQPVPDMPAAESVPDISGETIQVPELPSVKGVNVSDWKPEMTAPRVTEPSSTIEPNLTEEAYKTVIDRKIRGSVTYPSKAKRRNLQGKVIVTVTIGADGAVVDMKITQSSGHRILDKSVLKAVEAVAPFSKPPSGEVTVLVPIQFKLI